VGDLIALIAAGALWIVDVGSRKEPDYTSPVHDVPAGFTSAIASWNVSTPAGSWITVDLRARVGSRWTRWYAMGFWSADLNDTHRHSVGGQKDADGSVDTDTLNLTSSADAVQLRAALHPGPDGDMPVLRLLAVATDRGERATASESADVGAWGADLDVPQLTQRVGKEGGAYGGGGDSWCSPASVAMVMSYWGERLHHPDWSVDVPTTAKGTFDPVYDGCGNWPFNVAFASEHGLRGWVQRFDGLIDVERLIAAGIPVIASIRTAAGELDGAPYPSTDGHLLVVRGFTASGDVICNDPYGERGEIRRVYRRDQFERVWQHGSHRAVYLIAPPGVLAPP
jgi:hypothetical protein